MESERYLEALSAITPFQHSAPVEVVRAAQSLGLAVWESSDLPNGISGKLFRDDKNGGSRGFSIVVNAHDGATRRRFTIGHEIAHFLLHRDQIGHEIADNEWYRGGLTTTQEAEANRFAADLLMPRSLLREYRQNGITDPAELAQIFKVSRAAMSIRLSLTAL